MIENFFYAWPFFLEVDLYFCRLSIYGFPQTMFQLSIMVLLLISTRNPPICRVNIGSWLQISDTNCILQTLLVVKVQFPQAAIWTDDARYTAVSPKCLRFLHDICSFSSLQVPTIEITGVHDVNVLSFVSNFM